MTNTAGHNEISDLHAIFIAAPREISVKRFTQLVKRYLPKANIVLGIAAEEYVLGFERQPQFKMLRLPEVQPIIDKVATAKTSHHIHVLEYAQADLNSILQTYTFARVLLVNGSWKYAFHNLPAYKTLLENKTAYKMISPFVDEGEAAAYEKSHTPHLSFPTQGDRLTDAEMVVAADLAATESFDNSFQTGVSLGKKDGDEYAFILTTCNKVIPYQTYALHYGNQREKNLALPHDTNHYDTIHAEMAAVVDAGKQRVDLIGTTLFVNLLPCPNCARTLSQTDIAELVYRNDHSDGYAVKMLELAGKKVRRLV